VITSGRVSPAWSEWLGPHELGRYTLGVEEEAMLLDPGTWALAHRFDEMLPRLPAAVQDRVSTETHGSAFELQTDVAATVSEAIDQLAALRAELDRTLGSLGMRAAVSGTHPFAIWQEIAVAGGERQKQVYGSMRELARREPTFWQGRDTGLASARTPLFQAFPRVGIPRAFGSYGVYAETVDLLIRTEAVPEPTFLWWDVRPQPALGTVEIRVMDAQTGCRETTALVALVQCLVKLEAEQGFASEIAIASQEVISENRFLAARDGASASLIDPELETRVPVPDLLADLLAVCRPHAQELGCEEELASVMDLADHPPARWQVETARDLPSLGQLVEQISDRFS
jgi:carboxylate-amine ligase